MEKAAPETFPQLSRSPLREAVVDLRLREPLPVAWLEKLKNAAFDGFTNPQPIKTSAFRFEIPPDQPSRATVDSDQQWGRRYDSNKGGDVEVLQVTRQGMTLSILKGYTNWDGLRPKARAAWNKYLQISGPVEIGRLALRYINAIDLTVGEDYDKYLAAAPRIPTGVPPVLVPPIVNNFIQRVEVPFANEAAVAIITQTLSNPSAGKGSAILDIDVASAYNVAGDSDEVWTVLDKLRVIANSIFFSSITQKLLESFL